MAKTYTQKIFDDLDRILEKYPDAKVSDMIWALRMTEGALWAALPDTPDRNAHCRKLKERTKRYRVA